jgi:hypothetical protein
MKVLTLALGAVVATSAIVYLNAADVSEEADLVAPRQERRIAGVDKATVEIDQIEKPNVDQSDISANGGIALERDRTASMAKINLFRVLEAPSVVTAAVAQPVAPAPAPPPTPTPNFVFLGSFREGAELNGIVQVGEQVEFVKPSQLLAGFRIDAVETATLGWTHEPSATKGILRARPVK